MITHIRQSSLMNKVEFGGLSLLICFLKIFKRVKFLILPTPEGSALVKGIKMMKLLNIVPSRLLKSLTYDNN